MKKIKLLMFCILIANATWSQTDLHVATGGEITALPGSVLYVKNDAAVVGSLTVTSDATSSGSFIVDGSASGDISYVRYVPSTNWHFVSAPVTTQDIGTFAVNVANDIKQNIANTVYGISVYNNSNTPTERWMYFGTPGNPTPLPGQQNAGLASTAGNFVNGKGYSNLRASVGDYTFKGTMANADVSITVPDADGDAENHHWGVIGNPYPSFLAGNSTANATNLLTHNAAMMKSGMVALYFWDGAAYQAKNHSDAALYIAPGQGFVVEAKANGQTFIFPKAMQKPQETATTAFFRTTPMTSVTLFMSYGTKERKTRIRYLDANATTGLDEGYDAGSYRDGTPAFSIDTHLVSNSTGMDFNIQCLPKATLETTIVPLAVYANANEELVFKADVENLPDGVSVYLEDKVANTIKRIDETSYTLRPTEDLSGIGRFYMHTSRSVLNIEDNNVFANTLNAYKTNNSTIRITGLEDLGNASVKMYNITGKEVLAKQFVAQRIKDVTLPTHLATGVYILKVVSNKGDYNKKIIIE